jgi:hypothetical protein
VYQPCSKNKLGSNPQIVRVSNKRAQGLAEIMIDLRDTFNQPLRVLAHWHHVLAFLNESLMNISR